MTNGSTSAEKAKWQAMRSRPKKLTAAELHQRAVSRQTQSQHISKLRAEIAKATEEGNLARRTKARDSLRNAFNRGIQKNAELGIDPVYLGGRGLGRVPRGSLAHVAWQKRAKLWDIAHQPKPDADAA